MSSYWRTSFPGFSHSIWKEWTVRVIIITSFVITEDVAPFWREIKQEEVWLYQFPTTTGYVTTPALYVVAITFTIGVIMLFFLLNRNYREAYEALLVPSLAIPLCGLLTNFIKISVGRPRPDYYARCLPGVVTIDVNAKCTGDMEKVLEGRKSFPSGHSSVAFCAMGFISLYLAGKLCTFNSRGRGQSWRLITTLIPITCALLISISRTSDYHHHWQDVTVGGIIGTFIIILVYRQYYPSPTSTLSPFPYILLENVDLDDSDVTSIQHTSRIQLVKNV